MRFVIVTGMSGAGKSSALKMLEDVGYFVLIIFQWHCLINLQKCY